MIWLVLSPFAVLIAVLIYEVREHQKWLANFYEMPADEQERLARLWHQ